MKKLLSLLICVITAASALCVPAFAESSNASMTVYGLSLSVAGDSSLLYSDGKWLLLDAGDATTGDELTAKLQKYGIKNLDVYISHMHPDHFGGLLAVGSSYRVDTLYLPDKSIADEVLHPYNDVIKYANAKTVRYLNVGDTFYVGAAAAKVLGPVGKHSENEKDADAYTNNCSLTTRFTCGNFSYLTCGDIEQEEETALLNTYKNGELKSDIFKLSHHGYVTSNKPEFLAAVSPRVSYGLNLGEGTNLVATESGTYRRTYTARRNASKYGLTCMVGDEKKDFSVKAEESGLTYYLDGQKLSGMTELQGGDGLFRKTDKYYIKEDGTVLTGIQKLSGKLYNFSDGGCMERGRYDKNGNYFERVTSSDGKIRAYGKDGEMLTGLQKVYNENVKNWYNYFNKTTGVLITGKSDTDLVRIDGSYYAINQKGTVKTDGFKAFGKKYRYFGKDGKMKTGWQKINGKYYYFNKTSGYRATGLYKIGSKYYYFSDYGVQYKNGFKAFGKKYRYFDKNGVMKTGWQKINGKYYYFNKTSGYRATGLYKIGSSYYYFSDYGVQYKNGFKAFGKKYRYFDKNGKMAVGWKTIKSKKYYFDKNGYRVTGKKKIGKKTYRFNSYGALQK